MFDFLKKKRKEIIDYLPQSYFATEEDTRKPTFEDTTDRKPTVEQWLTKNGYFEPSEKRITEAFPETRPKYLLNEQQATDEINRLGTGKIGGFEYPIYRGEKDTYNFSKDSAFNRIVGTAEPVKEEEPQVDPMTTGASRPFQGPRETKLFGAVLADPNNKITDPTDPNYFPPAPNPPHMPGGVPMTAQADPTAYPPAPSKPSLGLISGLFEKLGADSPEKRSALGNSLISAGVAMMAPNGNNGMAAIGAGIGTGMQEYHKTLKAEYDGIKDNLEYDRKRMALQKEENSNAADRELFKIYNETPGQPLSAEQKSRAAAILAKYGRFDEAQKLMGETSSGDRYSKGDRLYDPVTKKSYDTVFDKKLGRMIATDPVTGEQVDTSNMQIDSAGRGKANMSDPFTKASREEEVQLGAAASNATSNIFNYDSMAELMETANEGGGLFGLLPSSAFKDKRIELERLGFNVAGDGAMAALTHFQANQMPAMIATMKGMGPLSDKDIDMLSKQTLSGDLSPETFDIVREKLTKLERFKQQQYRDWQAFKKENPDQNYSEWKIDYQDKNYNDFMNDRTNGLTTKKYNEAKAATQGEIRTDAQGNRIRLKPGADRRDPASWERI